MRLSTKIISLMVLMSLLTGVIVGCVTLTLMGRSFNSYLADNTRTEINTWRDTYLDYYEANGDSWLGVQNYVQQNSAVRTNYGGHAGARGFRRAPEFGWHRFDEF